MSVNVKTCVVGMLCFVAACAAKPGMAATVGDYDGDGKADKAVWRPSTGTWYVIPSSAPSTFTATQWGVFGDIAVPGDYDGDGKTDMAVWRPSNGTWYIIPSNAPTTFTATQWGITGDIPVPGDYDGDGKTDIAVWRPSTGTWYILPSSKPGTFIAVQWGLNGDIPVPGDYDGDGKTDLAVWRPSTGTWYIIPSSAPTTFTATQWGVNGDSPVPGDYDGDGKTDLAVWRPSNGTWYVIPSSAPTTFTATQWGVSGDIPVPTDYDGDGKDDVAVWRPSTGTWYIIPSSAPTTFTATQWGISIDTPVQEPVPQYTPGCVLYGQYVFQLGGTDASGGAGMVGSVTVAQNGSVVTGAIDFKDHATLLANQAITGGSCTNTSVVNQGQDFVGGTGQLNITTGAGSRTFNFAMRTHRDNGHLAESDNTGVNAAGSIQFQTNPTVNLQGSYAFGMFGADSAGGRYAIGGQMCANSQLAIAYLLADLDDNNTLSPMSGLKSAASFSAPDSNGRSTSTAITFTSNQTINLVLYTAGSGQAFFIESSPIATSSQVLVGEFAGVQGTVCFPLGTGGAFSNSTLTDVAFDAQGAKPGTAKGEVGVLQNINAAAGTASLTFDSNTAGTLESASGLTFTYNIPATGRGTASYTDPVSNTVVQEIMYMLPDGSHFFFVLDGFASVGFANSRGCTTQFNTCIGGGNYTFGNDILGSQQVSEVTIDTSALTFSASGGSSGSYTVDSTTGRGTVSLNNTTTFGDTSLIFYIKGPNNIFTMQKTNAAASVGDLLK